MPRRRRDCPICNKKNLAKLSNHLADIHQLSGAERQHYLSKAKSLSDQRESEEMLNRKRMRNESDEETSTASGEDIFSSSGEEDAERSEEMNDSDESEEENPWEVLIHEAAPFQKFYQTFERN